jgi:hypothetical protein
MLQFVFLAVSQSHLLQGDSSKIQAHISAASVSRVPLSDSYYCSKHSKHDYTDYIEKYERNNWPLLVCTNPENVTESDRGLECARRFCNKVCAVKRITGCPPWSISWYGIISILVAAFVVIGIASGCLCHCWRNAHPAAETGESAGGPAQTTSLPLEDQNSPPGAAPQMYGNSYPRPNVPLV